MATIYRHKESKFWYSRFNDPATGKRISRSTKTEDKKAAKRQAAKFESEAHDRAKEIDSAAIVRRIVEVASLEAQSGRLSVTRAEELVRQLAEASNPTGDETSFKRFSSAWLDRVEKTVSPTTFNSYLFAQKTALAALGPKSEQPMRKITVNDLEAIQSATPGASGSTINARMAVIKRILEDAAVRGVIDRNPANAIGAKSTDDSTVRLPFTPDEVRALIAASPSDEWRELIRLAASTGMRCGDLRSLTSENVNGDWITLSTSKTGSLVKAPITPGCAKWLEGKQGPIFPALSAVKTNKVPEVFDKIMKAAQVEKLVLIAPGDPPKMGTRSFHSLRHSFVSWLAESGVAADVRMKLSGHSSEAVHANYSHHSESLQRAVASAIPSL